MNAALVSGLALYSLLAGLGLFLARGLAAPFLVPWLAGYLAMMVVVSYRLLFRKEKNAVFHLILLGIIGLNFLVQLSGGPSSPLRNFYFLLAAAAAFRPRVQAYQAGAIMIGIEALNALVLGSPALPRWYGVLGFGAALAGMIVIIIPVTGRIQKQARMARERYRKLLSDADAVDPLDGGRSIDALTRENRQASNVSAAMEREGAFKGLFDVIAGIVPAHTYALFIDDRGDRLFTLRAIRSESRFTHTAGVQVAAGSGLIGISADTNQVQYLPHMVIPVKSLGYYTQEVPVKSFLSLPIAQDDRIVGVLAVDSLLSESFPPDTQDLLKRFAPFFSQIIEKIRLSGEMDIRARNFAALHEMSAVLNSSLDLPEILNKLADQIRPVVYYDLCAFVLYDEQGRDAVLAALRGYDARFVGKRFAVNDSALLSHLHRQWQERRSASIYYDPDLGERGRNLSLFPVEGLQRELLRPLASLYGRPLIAGDKFIGWFFLGSRSARAFSEHDRHLIDLLMNQAAMVIANTTLHRRISDMAYTDGLTGLLNHRTFMVKMDEEFGRLDRDRNLSFSLLLIDIDHFKAINDTYGHPVGDVALKKVAGIIRDVARSVDFVARYGGEEFAVGMIGGDQRNACEMAERIRNTVEKAVISAGTITMKDKTVSIGVAAVGAGVERKEELIKRADDALYRAKHAGRNQVWVYDYQGPVPAGGSKPAIKK